MHLELSKQEFEQLLVDIEQAIEELEVLSGEISWFCSEMPERLRVLLEIIGRAE